MTNKYLIITDDRNTTGKITKWAEIEKDNISFFKACFDYFMKSTNPEIFLVYDPDQNKVYKLTACKISEV